ncbi:MAG: ABC transporter ATP-binding protein [Pseudomonadota bacterium]
MTARPDPTTETSAGLVFDRATCRYGRPPAPFAGARDIDLSAACGEIVCLFGASGCGKTTVLRLAAGLAPLHAGRISVDGRLIAEPGRAAPPESRDVGFVFQDYVLFPHMTVAENVAFGLAGLGADAARARVDEELEAVGLAGFEERRPHELSGGQQQRVAVARALARRPHVMLLDEPFAAVDVVARRRLRSALRGVLKGARAATVLVTHDPEEAIEIADRVAVMAAGRIIECAAPADLYARPQTADGAALFPGAQRLVGEAAGGVARTAFGTTSVDPDLSGPVELVIRRGAARAGGEERPAGRATVRDATFAGPGWRAVVESPEGGRLAVETDAPPTPGETISVTLDPDATFAFPRRVDAQE